MATNIDRAFLQTIRGDIEAALAPLAEKYGVKIKTGSGSYGFSSGSLKVELTAIGEGGINKEIEQAAQLYGFDAKRASTETFRGTNGELYQLEGWAWTSSRYPALARRVRDGKQFKLTREAVIRAFPKVEVTK